MHVVMLTNATAPDKLGGLERYVDELSTALVEQGVQVSVVAKRVNEHAPDDERLPSGVRVIRYPMPNKASRTFAAQYPVAVVQGVRKAFKQLEPYDVVHSHYPFPALVPALTRTRRYVHTFHAPIWREFLVERQGTYYLPGLVQQSSLRAIRKLESLILNRADRVLTLSEFMAGEVALIGGPPTDITRLVPGGIDTSRFVPSAEPRDPATFPTLFTARRLVPRTGVAELVEAFDLVRQRFPGATLHVAGDGLQRPHIEAEVRRLGLESSVHLLGRISDESLVSWMQRADLVVTPTQELEGFGLSTAEAMACGTPCLVTPAGANPEVVRRLGPDLISKDVTPLALAEAITILLDDPARLAEIGARARAQVEPRMGWASIAASHRAVYDEVLGRRV